MTNYEFAVEHPELEFDEVVVETESLNRLIEEFGIVTKGKSTAQIERDTLIKLSEEFGRGLVEAQKELAVEKLVNKGAQEIIDTLISRVAELQDLAAV